jgi:hypothetical protein
MVASTVYHFEDQLTQIPEAIATRIGLISSFLSEQWQRARWLPDSSGFVADEEFRPASTGPAD